MFLPKDIHTLSLTDLWYNTIKSDATFTSHLVHKKHLTFPRTVAQRGYGQSTQIYPNSLLFPFNITVPTTVKAT